MYICKGSRERFDFLWDVVEEGISHRRLCCDAALGLVAKHVLHQTDPVIVNAGQQRLQSASCVHRREGALVG